MFCARCGKEIPQNVGFCPNCGAQVAGRNVMQNAQNTANQAADSAAGYTQQTVNNANPYVQQAAGGSSAGNSGYGQAAGPNPGSYQQYGQNPQMNYQQNYQQAPQMNNYQQPSFTVPEKKSKKGLMIGIIAAAVIAVAAILLFVWPGFLTGGSGGAGSPEKTIQNFGAALQKMDFKTMIKCFDPDSQKKLEGTLDQLDDMKIGGFDLSSLIDMMNLKVEMNVTDVEYDAARTTCKAYVHMKMSYSFMGYSDSQEEDSPINMVNVNGKWYIDGSSINLEDMIGDIMGGIY